MSTKSTNSTNAEPKALDFDVPPNAPIFYPTEEEFKDPLAYINQIRKRGEEYGICKIKPPPNWQPPFAVDVDKFTFTPRVQKLNELEAMTRIKLNFLDQMGKFWELQGSALKIPIVEKRCLDLYTLYRVVEGKGGFEAASKDKQWSKIAIAMGYPRDKPAIGSTLKTHYEKLLYPFNVFKEGKKVVVNHRGKNPEREKKSRRLNRLETKTEEVKEEDFGGNKELRRLQFKGAGPKMAVSCYEEKLMKPKLETLDTKPLKYSCQICHQSDSESNLVFCDRCDQSYHPNCFMQTEQPCTWRCPKCIVESMDDFGFEQAQREYTLQQFGEMADKFKADYFKMPGHLVPTTSVEQEFWRIVSSIDEDVTVEYGADLHAMDHGSGFPTNLLSNLHPGDQEYADSPWNLNNLPVLPNSVLAHCTADLSGVKVPWMYVGMCFATFCWHNEDHWSYSINYLHWGEPKTWYGVSGKKAELFEATMKSSAPELFQSQPDLLHQLVTIMNPNILMKAGVPVCRTDQKAGEFVVTFPRAYHAGFNQGYNFAEAVNFAPADWLRMGRECVLHYSTLRRACVFSHDELICNLAADPEDLELTVAVAAYQDMLKMVAGEKDLRKAILNAGVTRAERKEFEELPDDERQCEVCKTTCFLAAVTCTCSPNTLVCLQHYKCLCSCTPDSYTLSYRYTLDELVVMLKALKAVAEPQDTWVDTVNAVLAGTKRMSLKSVKDLLSDGRQYSNTVLLNALQTEIDKAEKCSQVVKLLDDNKRRQKLTLTELKLLQRELNELVCIPNCSAEVETLIGIFEIMEEKSIDILEPNLEQASLADLDEYIKQEHDFYVILPNIELVKIRFQHVTWFNEVKELKAKGLESINRLINVGRTLPKDPEIEPHVEHLEILRIKCEMWEKRVAELFSDGHNDVFVTVDKLLKEAEKIDTFLASEELLFEAMDQAREWVIQLEELNAGDSYLYFDEFEALVVKGRALKLKLSEVAKLEECLNDALTWRTSAVGLFKTGAPKFELMSALCPRNQLLQVGNNMTREAVVVYYKNAEEAELEELKSLRRRNCGRGLSSDGTFCLCQQPPSGLMMECELCKDWFHSSCVVLPREALKGAELFWQRALEAGFEECRFFCPSCLRSSRPRLDAILQLLVTLGKLYVRLPEGEALQCLTERAMEWQDRAKALLEQPQLQSKRKSTIVTTDTESVNNNGSSTELEESIRGQIEELLVEGNVLEVTLDENFELWKLLQASKDWSGDRNLVNWDEMDRRGVKRKSMGA